MQGDLALPVVSRIQVTFNWGKSVSHPQAQLSLGITVVTSWWGLASQKPFRLWPYVAKTLNAFHRLWVYLSLYCHLPCPHSLPFILPTGWGAQDRGAAKQGLETPGPSMISFDLWIAEWITATHHQGPLWAAASEKSNTFAQSKPVLGVFDGTSVSLMADESPLV